MAISNISGSAFVDEILSALHPTTGTKTIGSKTVTAPIKVRLITTLGSGTAAGTELTSGGSYTAGTGISIGSNWAAASAGSQSTNATVSQTNMPAATIVGIELWDSSATPQRLEYSASGGMTSKTTQSGDTLSFTSGAITSAIS